MSSSISNFLVHRKSPFTYISQIHKLYFLQTKTFSSNPEKLVPKQKSFTVNYLINKWGFSPDKARSAAKYITLQSTEKPDLSVALLKKHGFDGEKIIALVKRYPPILVSDPEKTLLPKIEYLLSLGMSEADMVNVIISKPFILRRSLEKQIIPALEYIKTFFESNGKSLGPMKRVMEILRWNFQGSVLPNIGILRKVGVPDSKILVLLQYQPRALMVDTEKFRGVVEEVKAMGFDPVKLKFLLAVHAFRAMNKTTWEKKMAVYKKWGWTEDQVMLAFEKHPFCMMISEDKITGVMDFLVNKMGIDSSVLRQRPSLFSFSLEKRLIPRSLVFKVLRDKGLVKKDRSLLKIVEVTDKEFLEKYVKRYENEAPEIVKLYLKGSDLVKSSGMR